MIVTSKNDGLKLAMFMFLRNRGVLLHRSEDFQAIGRVGVAGQLIGVVGYNGFCGRCCSMHIAGDGNWVSREFIRAAFDYPFNQIGVEYVVSPLGADNHRALKFDKHFGFTELARIPEGWDVGVDLVILKLKKSDCKWLREGRPVLVEKAA